MFFDGVKTCHEMGPGPSLKISSFWCLASETKSATLGLRKWATKCTEAFTAPLVLRLAGRVSCPSTRTMEKRGWGQAIQKSWTMARWWDLIQPGCKAGGFDKCGMSINYFLVCQSSNSHQDSHSYQIEKHRIISLWKLKKPHGAALRILRTFSYIHTMLYWIYRRLDPLCIQ